MQPHASTQKQYTQEMADELSHFLADSYALYLKTQHFHWNVTGPNFPALHKLFEEQYQELAHAIDEIAERIRALGCVAPASFSHFQKLSSLKEEQGVPSAEDMIKKLFKDHEIVSNHAAMILEKAQNADDEVTADLLIQRMHAHDKTAWMLRSSI